MTLGDLSYNFDILNMLDFFLNIYLIRRLDYMQKEWNIFKIEWKKNITIVILVIPGHLNFSIFSKYKKIEKKNKKQENLKISKDTVAVVIKKMTLLMSHSNNVFFMSLWMNAVNLILNSPMTRGRLLEYLIFCIWFVLA